MKKISVLVLVLVLVLVGTTYNSPSSAQKVMPEENKSFNKGKLIQELKEEKNLQIFKLGNVHINNSLEPYVEITNINEDELKKSEVNIRSSKKVKTFFMDEKFSEKFLKSKEEFSKLDFILDDGGSVFFNGNIDVSALYNIACNTENKILKVENLDNDSVFQLKYAYIRKNSLGQYIIGTTNFDNTFDENQISEYMIATSLNIKNDKEYAYIMPKEEVQKSLMDSILSSTAYAADPADFTIGAGWDKWGWHDDNYISFRGTMKVWRQFADLWDVNGDPYLAWFGQAYLDPDEATDSQTWGVYYGGDVNYFSEYNNKLFSYAPMSSPSTQTISQTIGGSLQGTYGSSDGFSGSIGLNYSIGVTENSPDVYINDNSQPVDEICKVFIGYKLYDEPFKNPRPYVIQTTRQSFSVITKVELDSDNQTKTAFRCKGYFHEKSDSDRDPYEECGSYTGWILELNENAPH